MKIIFKKVNPSKYETTVFRMDNTIESVVLDTNTYFLHDICHFHVEQALNTLNGFWGMLSQGYKHEQLFGKTNELTEDLRQIECVVGSIQSLYWQHTTEADFWAYMQLTNWQIADKDFVKKVIPKVKAIMDIWQYLPIGKHLELHFSMHSKYNQK